MAPHCRPLRFFCPWHWALCKGCSSPARSRCQNRIAKSSGRSRPTLKRKTRRRVEEKYCRSSGRNERDKRASRCLDSYRVSLEREDPSEIAGYRETSVRDEARKIRANLASANTPRSLSFEKTLEIAPDTIRYPDAAHVSVRFVFFPPSFSPSWKRIALQPSAPRAQYNFVVSNYPMDPITWTVGGRFIVSYVKRLTWADHESRKCIGRVAYTDVGVGWTLLWENVTARVLLSRMWSILCDNLEMLVLRK